ncbi:MAG: DegV family protein [Thermoflexales bacterium]|nr:DegV family protein [Thermoflexales bacterium]
MVKIVTDTGSGLSLDEMKAWGVAGMPGIYVMFGDESYRETWDISNDAFHAKLKSDPRFPTTSGATFDDFMKVYEPIKNDGIVSIHLSKKLSVTVDSARVAAKELGTDIAVIDTQFINIAQALYVREALRMANAGASVAEIKTHIEGLIPRTRLYILFETLENLRRGGRIGAAAALLGGVLQAKPILSLKDGALVPVERVRTMPKALARLKEIALEDLKKSAAPMIGFMHSHAPEGVAAFARDVCAELNYKDPLILEAGAAVAAHAGPGAIGIAYIL